MSPAVYKAIQARIIWSAKAAACRVADRERGEAARADATAYEALTEEERADYEAWMREQRAAVEAQAEAKKAAEVHYVPTAREVKPGEVL